jgi:hypothetical protein
MYIFRAILPISTTAIVYNIGRCLPDEVIYRIGLRIDANEDVAAIAEAVKVSKKTIYKLQLNLDIWGKLYTLPTVAIGRSRTLLLYQELVMYNAILLINR